MTLSVRRAPVQGGRCSGCKAVVEEYVYLEDSEHPMCWSITPQPATIAHLCDRCAANVGLDLLEASTRCP